MYKGKRSITFGLKKYINIKHYTGYYNRKSKPNHNYLSISLHRCVQSPRARHSFTNIYLFKLGQKSK